MRTIAEIQNGEIEFIRDQSTKIFHHLELCVDKEGIRYELHSDALKRNVRVVNLGRIEKNEEKLTFCLSRGRKLAIEATLEEIEEFYKGLKQASKAPIKSKTNPEDTLHLGTPNNELTRSSSDQHNTLQKIKKTSRPTPPRNPLRERHVSQRTPLSKGSQRHIRDIHRSPHQRQPLKEKATVPLPETPITKTPIKKTPQESHRVTNILGMTPNAMSRTNNVSIVAPPVADDFYSRSETKRPKTPSSHITPNRSSYSVPIRTITPSVASGIKNIGNSCYLNSVLQCFLNLGPFSSFVRQNKLQPSQRAPIYSLMEGLLMDRKGKKTLDATLMKTEMCKYNSEFSGYRQQDAHELLGLLLSSLQKQLSSTKLLPFVHNIFQSKIKNRLECTHCSHVSETEEDFNEFSLNFPPEQDSNVNLSFMLDSYFEKEILERRCPMCGKDNVEKTQKIIKLPSVIILHLKRFQFCKTNMNFRKREDIVTHTSTVDLERFCDLKPSTPRKISEDIEEVEEDKENFDYRNKRRATDDEGVLKKRLNYDGLKSYGSKEITSPKYYLASVVSHRGKKDSGHYICDAFDCDRNAWTNYDDSIVKSLPFMDKGRSKLGYIYFFINESLAPFEIMNQHKTFSLV